MLLTRVEQWETTEKTKAGHKQSVGNDFPAVLWDNKASVDCCNVLPKSCQTGVPTAEKLCKR